MAMIKDYELNWMESIATELIKVDPIPKHIGIMIDGNRRYGRQNGLKNATESHRIGLGKIDETIDMLMSLGVKAMTMFMFSISNFKRSKEEVDGFMGIILDIFNLSETRIAKLKTKGICIEFIGDPSYAPSNEISNVLRGNLLMTKECTKFKFNVAFMYSGRNELTRAANRILEGLSRNQIQLEDVTEQLLWNSFYMIPTHPVDMVIRTGGDTRLSDGVPLSSTNAYFEFLEKTWPEFGYWDLLKAVFKFQNHILYPKQYQITGDKKDKLQKHNERASLFIKNLKQRQLDDLKSIDTQKIISNPIM